LFLCALLSAGTIVDEEQIYHTRGEGSVAVAGLQLRVRVVPAALLAMAGAV
jgi:hypothetical protein